MNKLKEFEKAKKDYDKRLKKFMVNYKKLVEKYKIDIVSQFQFKDLRKNDNPKPRKRDNLQ